MSENNEPIFSVLNDKGVSFTADGECFTENGTLNGHPVYTSATRAIWAANNGDWALSALSDHQTDPGAPHFICTQSSYYDPLGCTNIPGIQTGSNFPDGTWFECPGNFTVTNCNGC
jgi:hypothetical protein